MRNLLVLTTALTLGAAPAFAANWGSVPPGQPDSTAASNIDPSDTHSVIAPNLPWPSIGQNADPNAYLHVAEQALHNGQTGLAQNALEMAETRLLNSTPSDANQPDNSPAIRRITEALNALAHHHVSVAQQATNDVMVAQQTPNNQMQQEANAAAP